MRSFIMGAEILVSVAIGSSLIPGLQYPQMVKQILDFIGLSSSGISGALDEAILRSSRPSGSYALS